MSCVVGAVPYFFSIDPYPFLLAQERKELLELCCGCIIEPYPFLPAACSCLYRTAKYSYELCCGCIVDSTRSCLDRKERYMGCVAGAVPDLFSIDPYPFVPVQESKIII